MRGPPEKPKRKLRPPAGAKNSPIRLSPAVAVCVACALGLAAVATRAVAPAKADQPPQSVLRIVADGSSAPPAGVQLHISRAVQRVAGVDGHPQPDHSRLELLKERAYRETGDDSGRSDTAVQPASYDRQLPERPAGPAVGASWTATPSPTAVSTRASPVFADEAAILDESYDDYDCGVLQADPYGDPGRFWIRAAYLAWWKEGVRLPALVTTSPADTPFSQAGVLGEPNTRILFGDSSYDGGLESGYRTSLGYWLDPCRRWGLEGDFFEVEQGSVRFHAQSAATGNPILGRPFFDVNPAIGSPREAAELVSFPGLSQGSIDVEVTDYFQSAGMWLRYNLCAFECCCQDECGCAAGPTARWYDFWLGCGCDPESAARWCDFWSSRGCRLDLIAGYRYYGLSDALVIRERIEGIAGGPLEGTTFDVRDGFRSRNEFHGGEIGLSAEKSCGRWSFQLLTKVAVGHSRQVLWIDGATQISQPGASLSYPAGIYALDSNVGTHTRDDFAMIPQLGVGIDYQLTCRLRVFLGYDVLYWANVARAPEQIDRFIDSARIPQSGREGEVALPFPRAEINYGSFWAQGINTGLDFRF